MTPYLCACTHPGAGLKAAWYGAEIMGDIMAKGQAKAAETLTKDRTDAASSAASAGGVKPMAAVLESIRADYAEVDR